ncbi:MAG: hypothetical protein E7632_09955, partial [Ruminococcaceae bacterium]|nr:hypothetical protein [Oscillospiraceae bacterium]
MKPEKHQLTLLTEAERDVLAAKDEEAASHRSRGYFAGALIRFGRNKSSVAAAVILALLGLYAVIAPLLSPYTIAHRDALYAGFPPYLAGVPMLDGGIVYESQTPAKLDYLSAIGEETGMDPVVKILGETVTVTTHRGEERRSVSYRLRVNRYFETGIVRRVMQPEEFERIQQFQRERGIQVIYPYVEPSVGGGDAKVWYRVMADGTREAAYLTDKAAEGAPYDSLRIPGDDGSYIYSV